MKVKDIYDRLKTIESLHEKILSIIINRTPIDKALSNSDILELRTILARDIHELKEREIKDA
jgi:hypothetical protein